MSSEEAAAPGLESRTTAAAEIVDGSPQILLHHAAQLADSAISPEIIRERGYVTAERKVDLRRLGFGTSQLNVPALVMPIYDVHGQLAMYQARPDTPRIVKGRAIKYETPFGAGLVLDVPRRVRDALRDPSIPLWITEGAKKVDAALSYGLTCIGVVGVYGWRGTNDAGGKTALADLECIALNDGRKVYLAFDSDAMEKREVHQALDRFANLLASKGASVRYVYIPSSDGAKVGLDDFLASGGTVDALLRTATSELHALPSDEPEGEPEWEPSPEALTAGKRLLDDPQVLERAGGAIAALGVAADLTNAKILYLAFTSRLLAQPINVKVEGPSSGGKSHLVQRVADTFPARATHTLDAMSERALVYMDAPLSNRYLIISEAAALHRDGIGATIMRAVAWGGRVRYATVEKSAGGLRPVEIDRPGPTGLVTTTTKRVEPELETRLLTLHVDDSPEVTHKILMASAKRRKGDAPEPPDLEPWHAAQWWLATEGDHEVTIPFAEQVAEQMPADLVRMRRDNEQLFNLISASAILHQRKRERDERGRIIATRADYELVYSLTGALFGAIQAEGVTPLVRETVASVAALAKGDETCSVTALARQMDVARTTADSRARTALRGGWLVNDEDRPRRPAKLRVGEALPEERPALPSPDDVFDGDAKNTHTPTPSVPDSSHRHTADSADSDAEKPGDDTVTSDESTVTTRRTSDEPGFVAGSADSDAENGDSDDVTTGYTGGVSVARLRRWLVDGRLAGITLDGDQWRGLDIAGLAAANLDALDDDNAGVRDRAAARITELVTALAPVLAGPAVETKSNYPACQRCGNTERWLRQGESWQTAPCVTCFPPESKVKT